MHYPVYKNKMRLCPRENKELFEIFLEWIVLEDCEAEEDNPEKGEPNAGNYPSSARR